MRLSVMLVCAMACTATLSLPISARAAEHDEDTDSDGHDGKDDDKADSDDDQPKKHKAADEDKESERESRTADAAADIDIDGAFAFSIDTTLFGYSKLSFDLSLSTGKTNGTLTNVAWGPSTNPVDFEFGYGLSHSSMLGLLLELGGSTTSVKAAGATFDDEAGARFLVGPEFKYFLSTTGRVRPFVMAMAGFTWAPPQKTTANSVTLTGFQGHASVGLHWFVARNFSIDPMARVGGGFGWGSVTLPGLGINEASANGSLFAASLLLGGTGWLL